MTGFGWSSGWRATISCPTETKRLGGIVGFLLRHVVGGTKKRFFQVFPGSVLLAAACGVVGQAFYMNHARATEGLLFGALVGLGSGLFFCLVALPLAYLTVRRL